MKLRREVKIGIFAVLTLLALYWGVNFLKGSDMFSSNNRYYATYDQVNGLQKASAIVIKGYKVGVISDISYNPQKTDKIVVEFSIRSKYKIPDNSKARIYSDGLLGAKAIEIELGNSTTYLQNNDTLRSEMDKDFFEVAGSELEFIKQKAGVLVENLTTTLSNINTLVEGNQESLSATLNNLARMTGTLNNVVQQEASSLASILSDMSHLSRTLKDNAETIDNILGNVEGFTDSLKRSDIPGVVLNLTSTLEQFNEIMTATAQGEGSVGKLLSDEALYDSLVSASGSLARLLDDIRLHPGRYFNISVFGSRK